MWTGCPWLDETELWPLTQTITFSNLQRDQRCKCEKNNIPSKKYQIGYANNEVAKSVKS